MAKWNGNIISKDARYRTQSGSQSRGIYSFDEQLQHRNASNWVSPFNGWPNNSGYRVPISLITSTSSGDNSNAYTAHKNDMEPAFALGTTGRLYFAIKQTSSTTYFNDFCIGAVQFNYDDDSTLEKGWSFNVLADYTAWQYATVTGFGTTNAGYENYSDIINAPSQSWASCVNGVANGRISRASGTSSSNTGALDGLSSNYSSTVGSPTLITVGDGGTIAQTGLTFYMFTEASGNPNSNYANKWWWVRSPEVTISAQDDRRIYIMYHACSPSGTGMTDSADEPLFRYWWIPS